MIKKIDINKIKTNKNNPRIIKDNKFNDLVNSIKKFPEMLEVRPLVVDENMIVLGGNMRLKALKHAGIKNVNVEIVEGWTDEQKKEFIIKDNISFGDWDWDILANDWENKELKDWGLDIWQPEDEIDYSILDDIDLDEKMDDMLSQTKKSIILEYPSEKFEPIKSLYDKLKNKKIDLPELFYKSMIQYDKK